MKRQLFFTMTLFVLGFVLVEKSASAQVRDYLKNDATAFQGGLYVKESSVDDELKVFLESTEEKNNRFSLYYHLNHKPNSLADLNTLEAMYAIRKGSFWYNFYASYTRATFTALSVENNHLTSTTTDLLNTTETLISFGFGGSFRDNLIQYLFSSNELYSTTAALLGWYQLSEEFLGNTYSGPGFKAEYGVHKRTSEFFHYGLKFSYNHALVKKAESFSGESSNDRSLNLSWVSIAFDISFYY